MADIDRFIIDNNGMWNRLEVLTDKATGRKIRMMPRRELDELLSLYRQTSGHLAYARSNYSEPGLLGRLTLLVAEANSAIYSHHSSTKGAFLRFFAASFPAAVWSCRRSILVAAFALLAPAVIMGAWLANSPEALDAALPEDVQEALIHSEFEEYYSSIPAQNFALSVTLNNIQVSVVAFAFGALVGVPTLSVLISNGLHIGVAAGLFIANGQADKFFGLILPHGLLELTAVILAGGAGLQMGWAMLSPGDRTRSAAVAEEGRRAVVIVLGTIGAFITAGLLEAFVTPATALSTLTRVGIGAGIWLMFCTWIVVRGRVAVDAGFTGHPATDQLAWERWREEDPIEVPIDHSVYTQ